MQVHTISTNEMSVKASIMLGLTQIKDLTIIIVIKNAFMPILFPFSSFIVKILCRAPSPCVGVVQGSLPTHHLYMLDD